MGLVFHAFIGQAKALLSDVHAQHSRQSNSWSPAFFALRIKRIQHRYQLGPRCDGFNLSQKPITPCHLLLGRIFQSEKLDCIVLSQRLAHTAFWQNFNVPTVNRNKSDGMDVSPERGRCLSEAIPCRPPPAEGNRTPTLVHFSSPTRFERTTVRLKNCF